MKENIADSRDAGRSRPRWLRGLIAVPVTLAVVSGGTAAAYFSLEGSHEAKATSVPALAPEVSTVRALSGFYPGAERSVRVTVRNPNPYPLAIDKIDAFSEKTKSGCPAFAMENRPLQKSVTEGNIPAHGKHDFKLTMFLNSWAGNACADQHFTVRFRVYASSRA